MRLKSCLFTTGLLLQCLCSCSQIPEYRERGIREFDVVQRQAENHTEFFLCKPGQCLPSAKTAYGDTIAKTRPVETNTPVISEKSDYPAHVAKHLESFANGQPLIVHFRFNSERLEGVSQEVLPILSHYMKEKGINGVAIRGETDGFGSKKFNEGLAEKRIQAVANVLTENGLPSKGLIISKQARCCRHDRPNAMSIAAVRDQRVVLVRAQLPTQTH